jgi:predicted NBD/HSP70 family sugar kinase
MKRVSYTNATAIPCSLPAIMLPAGQRRNLLALLLHQEPVCQQEVAAKLELTAAAANLHFLELREQGLVTEHCKTISGRGRPTSFWKLNETANLVVGAFLDPPFLRLGATDLHGRKLLLEKVVAVKDGEALATALAHFMAAANALAARRGGQLLNVHCALPGAIDDQGRIAACVNHPQWAGLDLEAAMAAKGCRVYCDAVLYANYYGKVTDDRHRTVMALYWDHGIAMTLGCNRRLLTTRENVGGMPRGIWEFGHFLLDRNGPLCRCGRRGCLEAIAGGDALARQYQPHDPDFGVAAFIARLLAQDARSLALARQAAVPLGETVGWVAGFLGVEAIVVSGAMTAAFAWLRAPFLAGLATRVLPDHLRQLTVQVTADHRHEMVLGACRTANESFFDYPHFLSNRGVITPPAKRS